MVITRPLYKSVQTRLDRVLGLTRENLTGVRVVRAFDKEKSEVDRFEDANELLTKMQLHVGHISALMNPLTYVIINLAIVALLYVGSIEINIGGMASGDVIALVNYMNQILIELVKPVSYTHLASRPRSWAKSFSSAAAPGCLPSSVR